MKTSLSVLSVLLAALFAAPAAAEGPVDINTADAVTLERELDGIGPSKAQAIVAHREQHGAFRSADELGEVKGIGLATIEQNRERIVVGADAANARGDHRPGGAGAARAAAAPARPGSR